MKKRNRNKNNGKFKSYTDILNYNNFLIELEQKQNKSQDNLLDNNISSKSQMDQFLKNIKQSYNDSNLNDKNYTGITPWESLLKAIDLEIDPNLYESYNLSTNSPIKLDSPKTKKSIPKNKFYKSDLWLKSFK